MIRIMACGAFSSLMKVKQGGGYSFADAVRQRYLDVHAWLEEEGYELLSAHRADGFGEIEWVEDFVERDLAWTEVCDVQLIMLPSDATGELYRSDGTMVEMGYALAHGKPLVILADDLENERNSFFLRSFAARKATQVIAWTAGWKDVLKAELAKHGPDAGAFRRREQRTHVEEVIDDLRKETEPHRVRVAGLDLTVLPGVLSPRLSHAPDALIARWTIPPSAEVLDLGCGSGVLGLAALAQGASRLVALDVNPAAVATAKLNIRDLGVAERAEARLSDTYSALNPGEVFDIIIFAAPYWDREAKDDLEKSCYDPDYAFFTPAVQQAHRWLRPSGSMYIIFSDQGDVNKALAAIEGSKMRVHATHLMRPSQLGGHIRIIWELRAR